MIIIDSNIGTRPSGTYYDYDTHSWETSWEHYNLTTGETVDI